MMTTEGPVPADTQVERSTPSPSPSNLARTSVMSLLRTYLVFTITSFPIIVDNSPRILSILTHSWIPGVKAVTEWGVRQTFFKQFVGGETVEDCYPIMQELRGRGVGTLLNYSVEVDEEHAPKAVVSYSSKESTAEMKELLRAIEQAGEFERSMKAKTGRAGETWLAVKIVSPPSSPSSLPTLTNFVPTDRPHPRPLPPPSRLHHPPPSPCLLSLFLLCPIPRHPHLPRHPNPRPASMLRPRRVRCARCCEGRGGGWGRDARGGGGEGGG